MDMWRPKKFHNNIDCSICSDLSVDSFLWLKGPNFQYEGPESGPSNTSQNLLYCNIKFIMFKLI